MRHLSRGLVVGMLVAATTVISTGCVVRARTRPVGVVYTTNAEVYATAPMPPPRVEVVTVSPGAGYVWTRGHWHWNGGAWVWIGGRWEGQRAGYVYVQPRYVYRGGRHVYVGGGWRASGAVRVRGRAHVHTHGRPVRTHQSPRRAPPPPAVGVH